MSCFLESLANSWKKGSSNEDFELRQPLHCLVGGVVVPVDYSAFLHNNHGGGYYTHHMPVLMLDDVNVTSLSLICA